MNDLTPTDSGNVLALPTGTALTDMFAQPEQVDDMITRIEAEVRSHAPDLTTAKGRKAIASLAHTVARSKTALDGAGKCLTDEARKQIAVVDAERRKIRDRLDALKAEVRKPLDDWEAAEEARIAGIKGMLSNFDTGRADAESGPDHIRHVIADIEATPTGADVWAEYHEIAQTKRESTLSHFRNLLISAEKREADAAELARLRAEAEERARRNAAEVERQAEAERAAEQKRLAAEAERRANEERQAAEAREAERQAQIERDKVEAAERAAKEAEARAAREAKEREEQHKRDLAEAKAREEAAAQRERDRIAAAQKAEQEAADRRRADAEHANRVKTAIRDALVPMTAPYGDEDLSLAADIAVALLDGKIPHIEVKA
ncbi:hypothetical protein A8B82_21245 [Sulfitobacter sp. EhC04]|uniref:hypothetical protein n=1 Tax=Sulfitobacter sp. EhC04 TaxID=1849168 RepID=UPI0007F42ED6|nr:hypothetical protein [Sulfitobacter sp. EhC04]OAN71121.1 hypothetical protein A8B82_21245 [Sulfitobacter sp. EhC04]